MESRIKSSIIIPGWVEKLFGLGFSILMLVLGGIYFYFHMPSSNFLADYAPAIALSPIGLALFLGGLYLYAHNRNSSIRDGLSELIEDTGYSVWQLTFIGVLWMATFYWVAQWALRTFPINEVRINGTIVRVSDVSHMVVRYQNHGQEVLKTIPTIERISDGLRACCVNPGDRVYVLLQGKQEEPLIVFGHGPYTRDGKTAADLQFLFGIIGFLIIPSLAMLYRIAKRGIEWPAQPRH